MNMLRVSKERRLNKDARATPSEREALQSGNGKLAWLVRSSRMDLAFRLVESQTRAQDTHLAVKDLLAYNKIVRDAKSDSIEFTFLAHGHFEGCFACFW